MPAKFEIKIGFLLFFSFLVLIALIFCICRGDKDDKKWVWNENNRSSSGRSYSSDLAVQNPKSRYNVNEETNDYRPIDPTQYYPSSQQLSISQRPTPVYEHRPPISGSGFFPEKRPGGVYGENSLHPIYGSRAQYYPQKQNKGVLTDPLPSRVKEGPIKHFDRCKCAEKFNCNSPGISYGHCDVGKQYCCYSINKDFGNPIPSIPVHSIENGILVGPGGPVDPIPRIKDYIRQPKQLENGYYRPGAFQGPQSGNYYSSRPGEYRESNEYSPANGILVGPTGSYDSQSFGVRRSAESNIKAEKNK